LVFDSTARFDSVSLKVRYDECWPSRSGLKEDVLKLWVYDTDHWVRINDASFSRDLFNHTVAGTGTTSRTSHQCPDPAGAVGLLGFAAG
jgi:hypothetical protein